MRFRDHMLAIIGGENHRNPFFSPIFPKIPRLSDYAQLLVDEYHASRLDPTVAASGLVVLVLAPQY